MPRSLPRLLALALALVEALPVGDFERLLEDRREIAAVVGGAGGGLAGNFALADLVAAAQLDAVDAGLGRGVVDQPLHEIIALGPAGAAVGADEGRVGEHALGGHFHQRRAVEADDVAHDVERRRLRRHGAQEAAEIAVAGQPQRQEMSVGVERELGGLLVVAAVIVGHEARRALVGPFHRPAERARGVQDADIFRIDLRLHAERAADIAGEHVHLVGRHLHDVDQAGRSPITPWLHECSVKRSLAAS